jgi:hypothetical protein
MVSFVLVIPSGKLRMLGWNWEVVEKSGVVGGGERCFEAAPRDIMRVR